MKPGMDDGKTHLNEKTKVSSDGADNFSLHQPAVDDEPKNKSKTPPNSGKKP